MNAAETLPAVEGKTKLISPLQENRDGYLECIASISTERGEKLYQVKVYRAGYGIVTVDPRKGEVEYQLPYDAGSCSCPDHMYRGRACKHMGAVRALVNAGRIPELSPPAEPFTPDLASADEGEES